MCYNFIITGLIILIILKFLNYKKAKEFFEDIFNNATRHTRNMSYDLRCDTRIPEREMIFNNPTIIPNEQVKCLDLK